MALCSASADEKQATNVTEKIDAFVISEEALGQRGRNTLWGAGLSLVLVGVIAFGHYRYPQTYNDVLLWSVVAFVVIANAINFFRYRRYLRLAANHRVEVLDGRVRFWAAGKKSELDLRDVAAVNIYRSKGLLRHIQVRLKNNRGIRLEGYRDLDRLAALLKEQIPEAHVSD